MSEFDAGGDESITVIGTRLSSHAKREIGTHDCRFGGERGNSVHAFGRGIAIPSKVDCELRVGWKSNYSDCMGWVSDYI